MSPRYALYFVPRQDTAIARFGASAIGYDIWSGTEVPLADLEGYRARGREITAEPRRYGFHATLKAPFHLANGVSERDLEAQVAQFSRTRDAVELGHMDVRCLSRFVALVPITPPPGLATLAADCVREFDRFRAEMSEQDRARRLEAGLTPRQAAYLEGWGYPYVLEEFRFHMTLTGPVPPEMASSLRGELAELWAGIEAPVVVDGITLVVQPSRDQPFRVKSHFPLRPRAPSQSG